MTYYYTTTLTKEQRKRLMIQFKDQIGFEDIYKVLKEASYCYFEPEHGSCMDCGYEFPNSETEGVICDICEHNICINCITVEDNAYYCKVHAKDVSEWDDQ